MESSGASAHKTSGKSTSTELELLDRDRRAVETDRRAWPCNPQPWWFVPLGEEDAASSEGRAAVVRDVFEAILDQEKHGASPHL